MRRLPHLAAWAIGLVACVPALASGQLTVSARGASARIGGLVQGQYTVSSIDAAVDDFYVRRARLRADVVVNAFVSGRVVTDFGGGTGSILDAVMTFHFSEAFNVSAGQFKRAFDIFELPNPSQLPLIEKDGRVEGYSTCTGVGSVCSYSRFTQQLQFAGRDQGVLVAGSSGSLSYLASLTNGSGLNTLDNSDGKSASGRLTFALTDNVRVSGEVAVHDYVDASGDASALAFGGELEVGTWRDGLHVRWALVGGDNWLNLDASLDPSTFLTFQGVASYYHAVEGDRIAGIEPIARVSYGDPDTATDNDRGVLVTPGIMFYVFGRNRIGANLDVYSPQSGDKEFSFKVQTTLFF